MKSEVTKESVAEILAPFRKRIDALDDKIVDLLVERFGIIAEVGRVKARHGIAAVLPDRVTQVRERCAERAARLGISADTVRKVYEILITSACEYEEKIIAKEAGK